MSTISLYLEEISKPFLDFFLANEEHFNAGRCRNHPGVQAERGGLKIHTLQVIGKALELNQNFDRRELIECCLVHDVRGCEELPLTDAQRFAIKATKGLPFREWRFSGHHRFVALILIADMWSAYVNEDNRDH